MSSIMLNKAINTSYMAHGKQIRRGWECYFFHPLRIAQKCLDHGMDEEFVCAALLHDVVEDSPTTIEDLVNCGFSPKTIDAVVLLTKLDGETSIDALNRIIASGNKDAMRIKLFDLEDNMNLRPLDNWPGMEEAVIRYGKFRSILLNVLGEA